METGLFVLIRFSQYWTKKAEFKTRLGPQCLQADLQTSGSSVDSIWKNGSTESSYSGNSVDAFDTLLSTLLARFLTYFRCLNWVLKEAGDQLRLPWEVCIRKHIPQLIITISWKMVGTEGFEPTLSWSQTTRLSQTGLCPDICIIWITLRRGQYQ